MLISEAYVQLIVTLVAQSWANQLPKAKSPERTRQEKLPSFFGDVPSAYSVDK